MTTHTWKCGSYLPHSWAILQMRHIKGNLWMRSSVLIWYWQIFERATVPGQYLQVSWTLLSSLASWTLCWGPSLLLWACSMMSPPLPPSAQAARSAMTQATSLPPPITLPPAFSFPTHPVKGVSLPGAPSAILSSVLPLFMPFWNRKATSQGSWWAFWG